MGNGFGWPCATGPGVARLTPYVAHSPTPVQRVFLCLTTLEAFFGGAAGGGKSDALLMAALQFADVPGYAALLLRRSYADLSLPGALLDRAREWLGPTDARYAPTEHTWHFPSGASLTFGYLEHDGDEQRYRSAEFQMVGFDEVTQFSEASYRFLASRLRRTIGAHGPAPDGLTVDRVPLRLRSASNPGDRGHAWVKRRLVDDRSRDPGTVFVPSRLEDNPHIDQAEYERALQLLDPIGWERFRFGDWTVRDPGEVLDASRIVLVEEPWDDHPRYERVRYWDLASTALRPGGDPDWTVGTLLARDAETGLWRVEHQARTRAEPHDVEALLARTAADDGRRVPIVVEQEPGASGKAFVSHLARNVLVGYRVEGDRPTGPKETRIRALAPTIARGELSAVQGSWLAALLDEVDAYPHVPHDDAVDSLAGAFAHLGAPRGRVLV